MRSLKEIINERKFYKYHNMVDDNIFINDLPEGMLLSIIITTKNIHMAQIVWGSCYMTYLSLDKPKYLTPDIMDKNTKEIIIKALTDNWNIVQNTFPDIKSMPDYSKLKTI